MFEYRYPLLEVVQAIDKLRESRGPTNKQICDFVRQQGRNPNDPMKILKTIRTLNKLVEEGVLIKKGRRYVFPTKPPELPDNEEENEDEDECEQEDENQDGGDSCDEEGGDEPEEPEDGEGEEDDDDDDDDDDDEEDEDDDDDDEEDDEECEGQEQMAEPEVKQPSNPEKTASKCLSSQNPNTNDAKPIDNAGASEEIAPKTSNIVSKKNSLKNSRKNGKGQSGCEAKNGKNKGGEAIAFCARDFIDSQYSRNSTQAKPVTLQKKPQDDLTQIEKLKNVQLARAFGMRKRDSKSKKIRTGNECRSRSPIGGHMKNNFFADLKMDHSDNLRKNMIHSQIFQEVTDTPMDIDHDNEVVDLDFDLMGHRNTTSAITPGVHLDRTESCCSQQNNKNPENIKTEPDFDCKTQFFLKKNADYKHSRHSMARAIDLQNKRLAEKDKEKNKREMSLEGGNGVKAEKRASLCSVCEKKKRNS